MDDPQRIKILALEVGSRYYYDSELPEPVLAFTIQNYIDFVCYHNSERLISFTLIGPSMVTDNKHFFRFKGGGLVTLETLTPQIYPYYLRVECVKHLRGLRNELRSYSEKKKAYPLSIEWCDDLVRYYQDQEGLGGEKYVLHNLVCPGATEGKSYYAMNSNYRPNSAMDTVLLFETKAGWNQHGGPELFTIDNHDPKGGCVLLNDGTVKFIRTKKELQRLRWK
jgi:hypothetical protein